MTPEDVRLLDEVEIRNPLRLWQYFGDASLDFLIGFAVKLILEQFEQALPHFIVNSLNRALREFWTTDWGAARALCVAVPSVHRSGELLPHE